ncbi:MAG: sugar ABC transporter ATP-binding protein [Planctomycetes bacterium]|nr:sugar ABC transporter ATP-binding protein [Planctomycetota bacterium]
MIGISKSFGSTRALVDVDLQVRPGEVHALVGENGAGKSTLMKVLSGALEPDAGRMVLEGEPYTPRGPLQARACGVAMIYQELSLAPDMSVEENVLLGVEPMRLGFVRRAEMRRQVQEALRLLHHPDIHPAARVGDLSIGAQQLVEVARALAADARVVVMDEPTSSLTQADTEVLFKVIRQLRDAGVSVIYISHFLEEVRAIADRFTVLRDGQAVGTGVVAETPTSQIIRLMVGRELEDMYHRTRHEVGEPVLDLAALTGEDIPLDADLELRRGEILGIAGLIGSGRTELVRAVFGLDPVASGEVRVLGVTCTGWGPPRMIRHGVGYLSEDRKTEGLAGNLTVADNLTLSRLEPYTRFGLLSRSRMKEAARRWIGRLGIRTQGPDQPVDSLSGGNQQKVALARLLHQEADVLLLDEPTRGIDVGSKADIYGLIGELAAQGKAILWISSYLPELLGVCDSLGVMHRGTLSEKRAVADWSPEAIMEVATGGEIVADEITAESEDPLGRTGKGGV